MDLFKRRNLQTSIFESPTFDQDLRIRVNEGIGTASISPSGRDVVLASQNGLHIVDLDSPYAPPRRLRHETPWTPADVQWSPFASRYYWIVTTSNQRALVWNLELSTPNAPIEHVLHGHTRAITDINFSPHHPDSLATCAVSGYVQCWDLRIPSRPASTLTDWNGGVSQVKWSLRNPHVLASSHDRFLRIWDDRMGITPIKSINAHSAKIYGVDWSHEHADQLLTCSLDCTTKIWAYERFGNDPIRVIQTSVPIRRARHTPFGSGVIAMPQRGEHKLHLYDIKKAPRKSQLEPPDPDYSFKGQKSLARDFLWRSRGSAGDGVENRDFQLITWGADNELILHRMREKHLKLVGYEKGTATSVNTPDPGRESPYVSFRDPPEIENLPVTMSSQIDLTRTMRSQPLHDFPGNVASAGMKRAPIPMTRNQANGALTMTYSTTQSKNIKRTDNDLIAWMKGVKFGRRTPFTKRRRKTLVSSDAAEFHRQTEVLSEEIIHVGETFNKVTFEEIDVSGRRAVVSFNGPWSTDKHMVFLRLHIRFPQEYPDKACPAFQFERLSAIPEQRLDWLETNLAEIANAHLSHQLGCLQAVLFYLLGEYSLDQSVRWLAREDVTNDADIAGKDDGSSSDDEENLGEFVTSQSQALEEDSLNTSAIGGSNALVPLSNSCGATFSPDGRLICFFLPKKEPPSMLGDLMYEYEEKKHALFEGFGNLWSGSAAHKNDAKSANTNTSLQEAQSSGSDSYSDMTSDSSSESDEDVDTLARRFYPAKAWRGARFPMRRPPRKAHSTDDSQHLSANAENGMPNIGVVPVISIYTLEDLLPHQRTLANDYKVHGSGPDTCSYNALIAENNNLAVTSNIWRLLELVLAMTVPLAPTRIPGHDRAVLLMASNDGALGSQTSRALSRVEAVGPTIDGAIKGDVKWSNHPFGRAWLVKTMLDYLDKRADIQSLAMVVCVLARPSTSITGDSSEILARQFVSAWPAPFIEYHTVKDFSDEIRQLSFSSSSTGQGAGDPWVSVLPSDRISTPVTPKLPSSYKTGSRLASTQPTEWHKASDLQVSSLMSEHSTFASHVPETVTPRNEAASVAEFGWARSFNLSPSPPAAASMTRYSPAKMSFDDYAVSFVPTVAGSVVSAVGTTNRSRQNQSSLPPIAKKFTATREMDSGSDTECDEPNTPPEEPVLISYKNQSMFDDEGCGRISLLDPADEERHRATRSAYARVLDAWGFLVEKQEVLKYNGVPMDGAEMLDDSSSRVRSTQRTLFTPTSVPLTADRDGLVMTRCCLSCGRASRASTLKGESKCVRCAVSMRILNCSICLEPVDTLLKSCLNCGHVAHLRCLAMLSDTTTDAERASRSFDRRVECEAGCGCECSDFEAQYRIMK